MTDTVNMCVNVLTLSYAGSISHTQMRTYAHSVEVKVVTGNYDNKFFFPDA